MIKIIFTKYSLSDLQSVLFNRFASGPIKTTTVVTDYDVLTLHTGDHYQLVGTIDHDGPTSTHGHFTATVKKNGIWTRCNDSNLTEIQHTAVVHGQNSLYFFEKIDDLTSSRDDDVVRLMEH